jgi:hypothetical protein
MKFNLKKPCKDCPFRSDINIYLTLPRVLEICRSLVNGGTFPCHKTTESREDGELEATEKSEHCAGALIFLEKQNMPNQMMRIAERLRLYDRTKLDMDAPIYNNQKEWAAQFKEEPTELKKENYSKLYKFFPTYISEIDEDSQITFEDLTREFEDIITEKITPDHILQLCEDYDAEYYVAAQGCGGRILDKDISEYIIPQQEIENED